MSFTLRETLKAFLTSRAIALWMLASVAATIAGPFGSASMPLYDRALLWTLAIGLAVFVSRVLVPVPYHLNATRNLPEVAKGAMGATIFSVPYAAMLAGLGDILFPHLAGYPEFPLMFTYVFPVACLIIGAFRFFGVGPFDHASETSGSVTALKPGGAVAPADAPPTPVPHQAELPPPETPPFMRRLKPALGKTLVRLSVQDHYVEATTTRGSQLILMRFSDALEEITAIPGWRIHRSHWVAESAIVDIRRRGGGKMLIISSDGAELPVSRTYQKTLRDAGLLRRFA